MIKVHLYCILKRVVIINLYTIYPAQPRTNQIKTSHPDIHNKVCNMLIIVIIYYKNIVLVGE